MMEGDTLSTTCPNCGHDNDTCDYAEWVSMNTLAFHVVCDKCRASYTTDFEAVRSDVDVYPDEDEEEA